MRRVVPALALSALLALVALPVSASAAAPADFVVTLAPDAPPAYAGPAGGAELVEDVGGERYAWRFVVEDEYAVAEFRVRAGVFDVERAEQVLPLVRCESPCPDIRALDRHWRNDSEYLFWRLPAFDVVDVDSPGWFANLTSIEGEHVIRLGLPGPGNVTVALERDVTPPEFELGELTDLTHFSFVFASETTERTYANLRIHAVGADRIVENPTPQLAFEQTFPVQGLVADAEYEFDVEFWDWSGNAVRSDALRIRTLAEPERPVPVIRDLFPPPNATLPTPTARLSAIIVSPDSPVHEGGLRMFVDKQEVRDFVVVDGALSYDPPQPLGDGYHSASIEVTNAAGGKAVARWSWTVGDADAAVAGERATPAPAVAVALAAVALAASWRGRRAP